MLVTLFIQAVGCYASYLVEAWEATEGYSACVVATAGTSQMAECFSAFLLGAGDAVTQFLGCFS